MLDAALAAIDPDAIARDVSAMVRVPSVTGDERAAVELFARLAAAQGLDAEVVEHDLEELRAHPGHPGEEAPRTELLNTVATGPVAGRPRLCLNGHLDVVGPGEQPWQRDPFDGAVEHGHVWGRGSADMKGGIVAALHAAGAVARTAGRDAPWDIVVQGVSAEEDGGLGSFALLERDADFAAALIPEPTALGIAAAEGGALTFTGTIPGVGAHAGVRLEGVSAIDRYVAVHQALQRHEAHVNATPGHPLMADLELPYPLSVGRIAAGSWSSQVPDLLTFEARLGVRVDETVEQARVNLEAVVREACPEATVAWTGGQFAPGATDADHPFVRSVARAAEAQVGTPPALFGVPYGTDLRLFTARGIPAVLFGPSGIELAHGPDERVSVDELADLARIIVRVLLTEP